MLRWTHKTLDAQVLIEYNISNLRGWYYFMAYQLRSLSG